MTALWEAGDLARAVFPPAGSGQLYVPQMRRKPARTPRLAPEEHKSPVGKEEHGTARKNTDPAAAQR